jgi:uncharacterized protein (TIGR00661 family)
MSRVLFTVCGVRHGHAARSSLIIEELMKEHKVMVVSSDEGYRFLKKRFHGSQKLKWFKLVFNGAEFDATKTFLNGIVRLPYIASNNFYHLIKIGLKFKPEIIVSDFDVNGLYAGRLFRVPSILISNMHLIDFMDFDFELKEKIRFYLTQKAVLDLFLGFKYLLVSSFVKLQRKKKNVFFFEPIVRKEILKAKPSIEDFSLVYGSKNTLSNLIPELKKQENERFVVYWEGPEKSTGNIQFKHFNEKGIVEDLSNCKAVFSHGGISLLSEAVILKKPCYVFSSKKFFERYFNGYLIERLGFGSIQVSPSQENIKSFFNNLPVFQKNFKKKNIQPGNQKMIKKIKELIEKETI